MFEVQDPIIIKFLWDRLTLSPFTSKRIRVCDSTMGDKTLPSVHKRKKLDELGTYPF